MPIRSCSDGDKPGYKWGDSGKCYLYTAGDEKSMEAAKMKAQMQGVAAQANGYEEKANEVTTSSMESGIKNPQRGYGSKKKKKLIDDIEKSLTQWFEEKWVDISRPKSGGGYRVVSKSDEFTSKIAEDLAEEEAMLAEALIVIARMHGKFNEDETGIWAGYDSPEENDVKDIGVKCSNCVLYEGNGVCKIIAQKVEDEGKCRFAIIPDGVVEYDPEDEMDDEESIIDYLKNKVVELFI